MRGSTVLDAASVATWHVKRAGDGLSCIIEVQDAKDSESGFTLDVTLKRFEFGDEHDAERESTLIVDRIDSGQVIAATPPKKSRDSIARDLRVFMTSFGIALDDHGYQVRLPNKGPKVRAVSIETVRPIYYAKRADLDVQDSKKTAFGRDLKKAIMHEVLLSGEVDGEALLWRPTKK
jgi:hypothetical protein